MTFHYCDICKKQVKSWKDLVLVSYDTREAKDISPNTQPKGRIEMCPECFNERIILDGAETIETEV